MLRTLLQKAKKTKPTGVTCHYCAWNGPGDNIHKAKVMNTDSTQYEIKVCPRCFRNGGLIDHDAAQKWSI